MQAVNINLLVAGLNRQAEVVWVSGCLSVWCMWVLTACMRACVSVCLCPCISARAFDKHRVRLFSVYSAEQEAKLEHACVCGFQLLYCAAHHLLQPEVDWQDVLLGSIWLFLPGTQCLLLSVVAVRVPWFWRPWWTILSTYFSRALTTLIKP